MRKSILAIFLSLFIPLSAYSQDWEFIDVFPPTGTQNLNVNALRTMHGVAVDRNGRIWLQPWTSLDTLYNNGVAVLVRGIRVYNPDGSEAPFSPITHFDYNGVMDTLKVMQGYGSLTGTGMNSDQNGNVLAAFNNKLYRFDADTGQPIHRYISPLLRTETIPHYIQRPAVTDDGHVFITFVFPGAPIIILDDNLNYFGEVTPAKDGFNRTLEVSADGKKVYHPSYNLKRIEIFYSENGVSGPYARIDTVSLAGPATESMQRHPITGDIWFSGGSANDMPMNGSGYESFAYYSLNQSTGVVTRRFSWNRDVAVQVDPRPRGLAFTSSGTTAYAIAFGANGIPGAQKFTISDSTQSALEQFQLSSTQQHSNLNLILEATRSQTVGTWISFGAIISGNLMLIESIQDNGPNDSDPMFGRVRRQIPMSIFPEEGTYELRAYQTNFEVADSDALSQLDPTMSLGQEITVLPPNNYGDVDNDNLLSPVDVAYVLQDVVLLRELSPEQKIAADVNVDSFVNSHDASLMLQKILTPDIFCMPIEPGCTPKIVEQKGSFIWEHRTVDNEEYLALTLSDAVNVVSIEMTADTRGDSASDWLVGIEGWSSAVNTEGNMLRYATAGAVPIVDGPILLLPMQELTDGKAQFQLRELSINGTPAQIPMMPDIITRTDDSDDLPSMFAVYPNFPNPFNPTTTIRFDLPQTEIVTISIYDLLGRLVLQTPSTSYLAGRHSILIDASKLGSGVYIYRIQAGDYEGLSKMTLIK